MENTSSHRSIQGRGSVSGFKIPPLITHREAVLEQKIVQDSINIANERQSSLGNGEN